MIFEWILEESFAEKYPRQKDSICCMGSSRNIKEYSVIGADEQEKCGGKWRQR